MKVFHSGKLPVCIFVHYFSCSTLFHICCCWGQSFRPVVVLCFQWFSPGGLPEWGHLSNLGLGVGFFWSFRMSEGIFRRSVFGSTIVLEGMV